MKKIAFLIFAFVAVLFQSCFYEKIDDVSALVVESGFTLTITEGKKNAIVKPKDVTVTTENGVMTISGGTSEEVGILTLSPTTLSNLTSIKIGSKSLVLTDTLHLTNDNLTFDVYGSGSFNGFIQCGNARINISDDGEMVLAGEGDNLTMVMTNSSKYTSPTFKWQNANVTLSDTAKCTINVVNSLTVVASDEANLGYIGVLDSNFTVSGNAHIFRIPISSK